MQWHVHTYLFIHSDTINKLSILSTTTPNWVCFLTHTSRASSGLDLSCSPPPPPPNPHASTHIQQPHTNTPFFRQRTRFYWKAWANRFLGEIWTRIMLVQFLEWPAVSSWSWCRKTERMLSEWSEISLWNFEQLSISRLEKARQFISAERWRKIRR